MKYRIWKKWDTRYWEEIEKHNRRIRDSHLSYMISTFKYEDSKGKIPKKFVHAAYMANEGILGRPL